MLKFINILVIILWVFFFFRCGTLVYHLRKPESLVSHGTMQSNLLTTYLNNPCKCTDKFKSKVSTKPTLYQLQRQAGSSPSSIIRRRRHVLNHFGTPLVSTNNVPSPNDRPSDWPNNRWRRQVSNIVGTQNRVPSDNVPQEWPNSRWRRHVSRIFGSSLIFMNNMPFRNGRVAN